PRRQNVLAASEAVGEKRECANWASRQIKPRREFVAGAAFEHSTHDGMRCHGRLLRLRILRPSRCHSMPGVWAVVDEWRAEALRWPLLSTSSKLSTSLNATGAAVPTARCARLQRAPILLIEPSRCVRQHGVDLAGLRREVGAGQGLTAVVARDF